MVATMRAATRRRQWSLWRQRQEGAVAFKTQLIVVAVVALWFALVAAARSSIWVVMAAAAHSVVVLTTARGIVVVFVFVVCYSLHRRACVLIDEVCFFFAYQFW